MFFEVSQDSGADTIPESGESGGVINYCRCNKVECGATLLSIVGGIFSPLLDPRLRLVGFLLWFLGNTLWIYFAYTHGKWGMWLMQFCFSVQNAFGIISMAIVLFIG